MGATKIIYMRILPIFVIFLAISMGFFWQHEMPLGLFYATLIPLMKFKLPPSIIGHGKMDGTPPVPDDMAPLPRPVDESFIKLPGGKKMPQSGLGMCCRPTAYDDVLVYRTVLWYLLLGGRHIDGAHLYLNHRAIGEGIAEAIHRGVKRKEIFVTTKIFPTQFGYDSASLLVPKYLEELGLEYIDLLLMHFPSVHPSLSPCKKDGKSAAECRQETWIALSEARSGGLVHNVGVSNFEVSHLQGLEGIAGGAPIANNQIEFNPFIPESVRETVEYCAKRNISITAYSPLGGLMNQGKAFVDETMAKISANNDNRRISQIMLRWAIQRGCAVIPGTGNPDHMKDNLSVYSFKLSNKDMEIIDGLHEIANEKGYSFLETPDFE